MRLSVYEASKKLGISESAVRQRAYRGTLESDKDPDGRLYVYVTEQDTRHNGQDNELVADYITALKSEIEDWKQVVYSRDEELRRRDEELKRKDHLLAAALERIPAIEPPKEDTLEPRESVVSDSETEASGQVPQDSGDAKIKESWWRRFFGVSSAKQ